MNFTLESLVKELERLKKGAEDTDGYLSVLEIARSLGRSSEFVRAKMLRPLQEAVRLEVKTRTGVGLDGRRMNTPVYRVKATKSAR